MESDQKVPKRHLRVFGRYARKRPECRVKSRAVPADGDKRGGKRFQRPPRRHNAKENTRHRSYRP